MNSIIGPIVELLFIYSIYFWTARINYTQMITVSTSFVRYKIEQKGGKNILGVFWNWTPQNGKSSGVLFHQKSESREWHTPRGRSPTASFNELVSCYSDNGFSTPAIVSALRRSWLYFQRSSERLARDPRMRIFGWGLVVERLAHAKKKKMDRDSQV